MSKHRTDLTRGVPLPSTWVNALMEFISTMQGNLRIERVDNTTIRVPAGTGNDQVAVPLAGKWRWITANITASVPAGAAQTYDVWAAANANDLTAVDPADATNYAFTISIRARVGGNPDPPPASGGTAISRKIGEVVWDGAKITQIVQSVGPSALKLSQPFGTAGVVPVVDVNGNVTWTPMGGSVPVGAMMPYAGAGDPGTQPDGSVYLLAEGRLVSATTYPVFNTRAGSGGGHVYNGGVDPGGGNVRLPDKRGRGSFGADNMGTAQGAAGRIGTAPAARGQNGGVERVQLAAAESGLVGHGHTDTFATASAPAVSGGFPWLVTANGSVGYNDSEIFHNEVNTAALRAPGSGIFSSGQGTATLYTHQNGSHLHTVTGAVASVAALAASLTHQNMPPYEADSWIVRVA